MILDAHAIYVSIFFDNFLDNFLGYLPRIICSATHTVVCITQSVETLSGRLDTVKGLLRLWTCQSRA